MRPHRPYIDLHCHLDGSITPEIAKKLAALQQISLPARDDAELERLLSLPPDCESLDDFLRCFALPLSLMQTREGIKEAVFLVQENLRSQGVVYAELRFAPQLHKEHGLTQAQVVDAALEGLHHSPLLCNLILCCMRGKESQVREANLETVELARRCLTDHGGVAALDLAGAEGLYPTRDFQEEFRLAASYGIPFTIHAGEADGPDSVRWAIEMGARRIGHGVRAVQNPQVLALLKERHIPLELCPTSNRQTRAVTDMAGYPLRQFLMLGIPVTVNTDDMAICRTTVAQEFAYLRDHFSLTPEEETLLYRNAVEAAFTNEETRQILYCKVSKS